jgi:hypothetical protein
MEPPPDVDPKHCPQGSNQRGVEGTGTVGAGIGRTGNVSAGKFLARSIGETDEPGQKSARVFIYDRNLFRIPSAGNQTIGTGRVKKKP